MTLIYSNRICIKYELCNFFKMFHIYLSFSVCTSLFEISQFGHFSNSKICFYKTPLNLTLSSVFFFFFLSKREKKSHNFPFYFKNVIFLLIYKSDYALKSILNELHFICKYHHPCCSEGIYVF